MAGMMRKLMRSVRKAGSQNNTAGWAPASGMVRAGMHQKAEHDFRRSRMSYAAENGIPSGVPDEELQTEEDEPISEAAEETAVIGPDEEILEEISDPEAAEAEENTESGDPLPDQRHSFDVDYSGERIPEMAPVTGGTGVDPRTELTYSSGDGSPREIPGPLPGRERTGILPFMPPADASFEEEDRG